MQSQGWETSVSNESNSGSIQSNGSQYSIHNNSGESPECEHTCRDSKYGELCLSRVKQGETLVGARIDYDMQINCQIWV